MNQCAGALEFLALHAVQQRKGQEQQPGGAVVFPPIWLALDEKNDRIDAADHPGGDYFVQAMQLACFQFEPLAPDRLGLPSEVEEPKVYLYGSPMPADAAVDGVVQVPALKEIVAGETHQRPGDERDGRDHIQPAKPRQRGGNVVTQGRGQILPPFRAFSLAVAFEGQNRDSQPVTRRQG
jgi:hypothetical protein